MIDLRGKIQNYQQRKSVKRMSKSKLRK